MAVEALDPKAGRVKGGSQGQTGTRGPVSPSAHYDRPPEPEDEGAVLAWTEGKVDRARRREYPWHAMYYLAAANVVGRQWATFNPRRRTLEDPIVPADKVLLTLNQILPMVLRESSKLSLGRIPWTVVPTSLDEEATAAARLDGKLLEHFWEVKGMRRWEGRMNLSRSMFGMCFAEPDWDYTQGKMKGMYDPADKNPNVRFEGDAVVKLRHPFGVQFDQDGTEFDDLRWISCTEMVDVGKLRLMYDRGDEVVPEEPDEQTYLEHRMQYLSSHYFQAFTSRGDYDRFPHHGRRTKFWFYPDDRWPKGREIHKAGNVVLYDDVWKHRYLTDGQFRRHPLVPFYYTQIPLRIRGQGMVENLLDPQWEYNKKRSQFVQILNAMAKPKWMAAKGHKLPLAPNDIGGELLEYSTDPLNPGGKPEAVLPQIPTGDFDSHLERTMADMQNTASQHEVSYGRTPPGVSAGVAIEQLIAQDDAAKGLPVADSITGLQEIGYAVLGLYRQYAQKEMLITIAGRDYQHEFHSWKRDESDAGSRVQIVSDGSLPMTRGQKREMVKELIALQILDPLNDRNKILQYLEFGQLEEVFHQLNQDVMIAKRENKEMLDTMTVSQVYPEDDHEVHLIEHTNCLKARRELDPVALSRIRLHIKYHLFFKGMIQTQTSAMMAQAETGGDSGIPIDEVGARVGDEAGRELPNEEAGPERAPDRGQARPESGTVGKKMQPNDSGTPGNEMRERKQKEKQ